MEQLLSGILLIAGVIVAIWFFIILPAGMAERRGRSGFGWVLVSLIFSPFLAIFLLAVLGDAQKTGNE
jgi:hypothetical protein